MKRIAILTAGGDTPANPASGTTWWNGTIFQVWDGTTWKAVGPTPIPAMGTTTKVFQVSTATTSTITTSTWVIAPINGAPTIDTQNGWDSAGHRFIAKQPGIYSFECIANNVGTGQMKIALMLNDNGGPYADLSSAPVVVLGESNGAGWASANGLTAMNGTTDFVRLWVANNGGTSWYGIAIPNIRGFLMA